VAWPEIEPLAARLEAEHDPRAALGLYRSVTPAPHNGVNLGIARTSLALGDTGHAVDYARRARKDDPTSREAFRIETTGLLRRREHTEALACTEAWAQVAPDDGPLHYARGKALLGLSRLPEARDAFDRAIVLEPTMLEAMLLRREVDRYMKKQRSDVGAQAQMPLEFPPELAGFRDAMVSGHVIEAIALLRTERYATDALAQLLLAQLLAFDGEHAEALAIFLRYVDGEQRRAGLVGAAECCLALGHSEEALAAANRLDPRKEIVAIELRARAFAQLGRDAEAEAELQRYVAANRGDVRVRNAQR
jgi:tetratricopeptide (TPR) repeat protein